MSTYRVNSGAAVVIQARGNRRVLYFTVINPITQQEQAVDFANVTRMILSAVDLATGLTALKIDTDEHPDAITWEGDEVTLEVGSLITGLAPRSYHGRLTAIDGTGRATELVHEAFPQSNMRLVVGAAEAV